MLLAAMWMVILGAGPIRAQHAVHPGYPNVNERVEIAPGETVHLLNRVLVDRSPGMRPVRRVDFQYRTAIPAGDVAGRAAQAERAAQAFGPQAMEAGARMLAIAICDTDACARRDEPPRVWFVYELRDGNVWKPLRN
jgi:hypothetical protein